MDRKPRQSELTESVLAERALGMLARREHSRFELRRKLLRGRTTGTGTGKPSEGVQRRADAVLDDLVHRGLLSDLRFAESFVRRGIDRGHGPLKIRAGLRSRGVAEDVIDDTLTFPDSFWLNLARAAQARRFGNNSRRAGANANANANANDIDIESEPNPTLESRSEWARRARFLAARGFASDIIYRTLGPQTV